MVYPLGMFPRHIQLELLRAGAGALGGAPSSPGALAARQALRLRRLVRYAARCSPYYRRIFADLGLKPSDIRAAEDLVRLPVLEKQAAREQFADIASTEIDLATCPRQHTNGTSGSPLAIPTLPLENLVMVGHWSRCYADCGASPWGRQVKVALPFRVPKRRYLGQRLGFFRRGYVDSTLPVDEKIRQLRALRPDSMVCWACTLDEITGRLEDTDAYLDIPVVFSTANMLWPDARRRAQARLHARVADVYGAVETGPVAWECERQAGYHVYGDQVIVELLDEAGRPAREGRLVCTVLWRRAFPLIRYAIGDLARWAEQPCACGRPYPLLQTLTGRATDLIRLPDGTRISTVTLRVSVFEKPGVRQYQFVQDAPTRFRLRLVTGPDFTPGVERAILDQFHAQFGGAFDLRVVKLRQLRDPPGVKFTPLVSLEFAERLKARGVDVGAYADDAA